MAKQNNNWTCHVIRMKRSPFQKVIGANKTMKMHRGIESTRKHRKAHNKTNNYCHTTTFSIMEISIPVIVENKIYNIDPIF